MAEEGRAVIEENEALLRDWERARRAAGFKPRPGNADALQALEAHAGLRPLAGLGRGDILDWVASMDGQAPSGRLTYFSAARAFYAWAASAEEGILEKSPMAGMKQPKAPLPPAPIPREDDVRLLLTVTERDKTPMGTRDAAMIRLMCDTGGPRASEVATMLIAGRPGARAGVGLDLAHDTCAVVGKGDKARTWPISAKTGRAAARWVRARDRLPHAAGHPRLWIGFRGVGKAVTYTGVEDALERRCIAAGVPHMTPHKLRHFAYHHFLKAGGRESDAMLLFGWDDDTMPRRYARALAEERSLEAGYALAIGDQW